MPKSNIERRKHIYEIGFDETLGVNTPLNLNNLQGNPIGTWITGILRVLPSSVKGTLDTALSFYTGGNLNEKLKSMLELFTEFTRVETEIGVSGDCENFDEIEIEYLSHALIYAKTINMLTIEAEIDGWPSLPSTKKCPNKSMAKGAINFDSYKPGKKGKKKWKKFIITWKLTLDIPSLGTQQYIPVRDEVHIFTPCCSDEGEELPPPETKPPKEEKVKKKTVSRPKEQSKLKNSGKKKTNSKKRVSRTTR